MADENDCMKLRDAWYAEAKQQTPDTLPAFFKKLADHPKDYNTICYATAAAAIGAAWAMDRTPGGGISGFQGGAIMWEFMGGWNGVKFPARLIDYNNMLFPQYEEEFRSISKETWDYLRKEAKKKLKGEPDHTAGRVVSHWKSIADGNVPFGFEVRD